MRTSAATKVELDGQSRELSALKQEVVADRGNSATKSDLKGLNAAIDTEFASIRPLFASKAELESHSQELNALKGAVETDRSNSATKSDLRALNGAIDRELASIRESFAMKTELESHSRELNALKGVVETDRTNSATKSDVKELNGAIDRELVSIRESFARRTEVESHSTALNALRQEVLSDRANSATKSDLKELNGAIDRELASIRTSFAPRTEVESHSAALTALKGTVDTDRASSARKSDLDKLKAEVETLQRNSATRPEVDTRLSALKTELEDEKRDAARQSEFGPLKASAATKAELASQDTAVKALKVEVDKLRSSSAPKSAVADLDSLMKKEYARQSEFATVRSQVNAVTTQAATLKTEINSQTMALATVKRDCEKLQGDCATKSDTCKES
jgi:hypothetical protein